MERSRSPRETGSTSSRDKNDADWSERRREERTRTWKSRSPIRARGERSWGSWRSREKNQSSSTASKPYQKATRKETATKKTKHTPFNVFSAHRALSKTDLQFCGFYWHSTRLASKGTNEIFNELKQSFQSKAIDGKLNWEGVRELLFEQKKCLDTWYRNMMYHFALGGDCEKCDYWDDVYKKHLANVDTYSVAEEITDSEMLEAAEAVDAANQ
uniref:Non-structural protein NP-1 n=1 Tax=Bovine parvovirus 1 TaxID=2839036 RepID=A0A7T1NVB8_PAVBP|nr:nonstructural protein [Bovine parvovirus 1]QPO14350.1 nonstructural protein [Bovine parvovirus 1]